MGPRLWDAETSSTNAELIISFPGHRGWWSSSAAADWPFNLDGPSSEGLSGHSAPCGGIRCCA